VRMWHKDRIGGLLLLVFFVGYGLLTQQITLLPTQEGATFTAKTLPQTLTLLGLCGALWLVIRPSDKTVLNLKHLLWLRFASCLVLMSLYGVTLRPLGFLFATVLFLTAGFTLLGERRLLWSTFIAVVFTGTFWTLMQLGLGVYLNPWPSFLASGL
jgi:putative tricarboxylic transport membrane protein